jgi:four helix bundle protein
MKGLESLEVWQGARELVVRVYRQIVPLLPPEEKWGLAIQLRKSVQSIPANIAEGFGRFYYQDGVRFCYIARGSLEETYSHLCVAKDLGYIDENLFQDMSLDINKLRRMLSGYIAFLKRSKQGVDEPGHQMSAEELSIRYTV